MNKKDRNRLMRLQQLIDSVPFPQSGGGASSQSITGLAAYSQDMRNFLPALRGILKGMVMQEIEKFEKGWDYEDPDDLMNALEQWIEKRKKEQWCNVTDYDFRHFRQELLDASD